MTCSDFQRNAGLSGQITTSELNIDTDSVYLKENLEFCIRRDERGGSDGVPFSPGVGNSLRKRKGIDLNNMTITNSQ